MPKFVPLDIFSPVKGLVTALPSTMIVPQATPSCENVRFSYGVVRNAPGVVASIITGTVTGTPMLFSPFVTSAGVTYNLMFTTSKVARVVNGAWSDFTLATWGAASPAPNIDNRVTACVMGDGVIFTNGTSDGLHALVGAGPPVQVVGPQQCRAVATLGAFAFQLAPTIGGTFYPHRVKWSDAGTYDTWTGGLSGYEELYSAPGYCRGAVPLGSALIVYKDESIVVGQYVGGLRVWAFDQRANIGCKAINTVQDVGNRHLFLGDNANVYAYDGTYSEPMPVSDAIRNDLMGRVDPANIHRSFAVVHRDKHAYLLFPYTTTSSTVGSDTYYEYNYKEGTWARNNRTLNFSAAGALKTASSITIDTWMTSDMTYTLDDFASDPALTIDSFGGAAGSDFYVVGKGGTPAVYDLDYSNVSTVSGAKATCDFQTPDFAPTGDYEGRYARWVLLEFEAQGTGTAEVSYSTDEGQAWTVLDASVAIANAWNLYRVYPHFSSRKVRFRFVGSSLSIRWLRPYFLPGATT